MGNQKTSTIFPLKTTINKQPRFSHCKRSHRYCLLGHSCVLHWALSVSGPKSEQSSPPCSGFGRLHFLFLVFIPPPHETLQALYFPQGL